MCCTQGEQELEIRCTTFVRSICTITEQHSNTGPLRKPSYGDRSRCKCCQWHLAGIMWCSEKEMHLNFAIRVFIIGDGVRIWLTIAWSWIMTFIRWRRFTFIGNHFSFWSKRSTVIYIDPSGSFQYIYIAYSRSCRFESSLHSIKNESLDSCRTNGVRCHLKHAALKKKPKKKIIIAHELVRAVHYLRLILAKTFINYNLRQINISGQNEEEADSCNACCCSWRQHENVKREQWPSFVFCLITRCMPRARTTDHLSSFYSSKSHIYACILHCISFN